MKERRRIHCGKHRKDGLGVWGVGVGDVRFAQAAQQPSVVLFSFLFLRIYIYICNGLLARKRTTEYKNKYSY